MSFLQAPPKPQNPLARHRVLSPTAAVKVSPLQLGGISLGKSWAEWFGKPDDAFDLLDAYAELGGNFIDTANLYNAEESETLVGEWMEKRQNRDQMVIATKYTAGYKSHERERLPIQSNYVGNSAKSMHVSVRDSLKKLRTEYIDILYLHWWDFTTSVEEVMRHLNNLVQRGQVLYLGVSNTPSWVVVKANDYARQHGLTPFSVYQGRWNAALRDMEADIIPMCEDQGMAIVPWAALGAGQFMTDEERHAIEDNDRSGIRQIRPPSQDYINVSKALQSIAETRAETIRTIALAYVFSQSTYVFPIVGVHTVEHVKAMASAVDVKLTEEEIKTIHDATSFVPAFPMNFIFGNDDYDARFTGSDNKQYQMAAWIDCPKKQAPY